MPGADFKVLRASEAESEVVYRSRSFRRFFIKLCALLGLTRTLRCPQCTVPVGRYPLCSRPDVLAHVCGYRKGYA